MFINSLLNSNRQNTTGLSTVTRRFLLFTRVWYVAIERDASPLLLLACQCVARTFVVKKVFLPNLQQSWDRRVFSALALQCGDHGGICLRQVSAWFGESAEDSCFFTFIEVLSAGDAAPPDAALRITLSWYEELKFPLSHRDEHAVKRSSKTWSRFW